LKKLNTKKILGFLAIIAIIVVMLAPAMPAAAEDTANWPLILVGTETINLSKLNFETMAAAHPSNIITEVKSGVTTLWKGVAVWRLVALVDDGEPTTLNSILASVISVQGHSTPVYASTALTSDQWYGTNGDNEENVIVANEYSTDGGTTWIPLAADKYPLKITGTVGGTLLSGSSRPGQLTKIELLNLPASSASTGILPATQSVANGATFNVNLNINLVNHWSRGWQLTVDFDASKMSANSVTEGTFLNDYATANGGGTVSGGAVSINNTGGHIVIPGYAISNAGTSGPTGTGTLCTISFTAKPGVNDVASITLNGIVISGVNAGIIPDVATTSGTVNIGTMPLPDLVVSAASTAGFPADSENYTITYTITNNGDAAAGASTTSIIIDGMLATMDCPALAVGANSTNTLGILTLDGTADSVLITADSAAAVNESNESNNTRTTSYSYAPPQPGDVPVSGTTQQILTFVLPDPVSWDPLNIGENAADRTMKVLSNQSWQVTIRGTNDGYMTKYSGTSYDPLVKLNDALYVMSENNVTLSGLAQILADGLPAEQQLDGSGDTRSVIIKQQLYYTDPALPTGYYYLVVMTFTASPTF
jgi:hypothetical protein